MFDSSNFLAKDDSKLRLSAGEPYKDLEYVRRTRSTNATRRTGSSPQSFAEVAAHKLLPWGKKGM